MQYFPVAAVEQQDAPITDARVSSITQPNNARWKVEHKMTIGEGKQQVFACQFDPEDRYLACANGDGFCRLYNTETGKMAF